MAEVAKNCPKVHHNVMTLRLDSLPLASIIFLTRASRMISSIRQEVREDVMLRLKLLPVGLAAAVVAFTASYAGAEEFSARLNGFQELGSLPSATAFPTGAVLSNGTGTASLRLNKAGTMIEYTLTYSDVGTTQPNTGNVSQAHIHFGKSRDSGGIMVFFCGTMATPGPAGTPTCPGAHSGTVTSTWTPSSVVGPAAQNISPGNFDGLVAALRSNTAYANIHTTPGYPAGEIRGQIRSEDQEDQDDHHDHHDHHH